MAGSARGHPLAPRQLRAPTCGAEPPAKGARCAGRNGRRRRRGRSRSPASTARRGSTAKGTKSGARLQQRGLGAAWLLRLSFVCLRTRGGEGELQLCFPFFSPHVRLPPAARSAPGRQGAGKAREKMPKRVIRKSKRANAHETRCFDGMHFSGSLRRVPGNLTLKPKRPRCRVVPFS